MPSELTLGSRPELAPGSITQGLRRHQKVVESFEVHWLPLSARLFEDVLMVDRDPHRQPAMQATLERIKAAAVTPVGSATGQ